MAISSINKQKTENKPTTKKKPELLHEKSFGLLAQRKVKLLFYWATFLSLPVLFISDNPQALMRGNNLFYFTVQDH